MGLLDLDRRTSNVPSPPSPPLPTNTSRKKDTLPTWALFATAYPGEELGSRAYNLPPSSRLPVLIGVLARNASFGWLVKLSFSLSETISDSDLRALPGISNLQTLCVSRGCGGTEVDDGIVRSWCRAAVQSAGFSRLRVLRLRGCGRVTSNVLVYTEWVRGLRWLDLTGCHGSVVCDPGNGWELVGVEVYKADRREWKKREEVAGVRPVVKIKLGVYNKAGGDREVRFVRRRDEAGTASVKRKAGDTVPEKKKVGAVVRRKRMKDMGDLLAEFQNPRKQ